MFTSPSAVLSEGDQSLLSKETAAAMTVLIKSHNKLNNNNNKQSPISKEEKNNSIDLSKSANTSSSHQEYVLYHLTTASGQSNGIKILEIHFTGSFSAKIIDAFKKIITDYIKNTLHDLIWPNIKLHVDPLLTKIAKKVNSFLLKYVPSNVIIYNNYEAFSNRSINNEIKVDYEVSDNKDLTSMNSVMALESEERKLMNALSSQFLNDKDDNQFLFQPNNNNKY